MNWENGLYACAGCDGEFDSNELVPVVGGVDTDYCEDGQGHFVEWMTGKRVEMTRDEYERSNRFYTIDVCPECYQRRVNETALKLLS